MSMQATVGLLTRQPAHLQIIAPSIDNTSGLPSDLLLRSKLWLPA